MPSENFESIGLPAETAKRLREVKDRLLRQGFGALPEKLQPKRGARLTNGLVVELALSALEAAMKRER